MKIYTEIIKSISKKKILLHLFLLFLITVFFFHKGIFLNEKTIIWDTAGQFYPSLWFNGHYWNKGILPLWNPFLFNGYPAFADPQNQTFYPVNILISIFTPFTAKIVYFQLVLHFFLSGVFIYLLASLYIKSSLGRLISSIIYMFSGVMINHFQHLTMINSFTWLPLIIFFLELGWRKKKFLFFIPAGLTICFLIFAGHPQTTFYTIYIILSFSVFACFYHSVKKRFEITPLIISVAAIVFGLTLSAIQLIPSYEFSVLSNRSGNLPYELVTGSGQLHPFHLFTFFVSNYFGESGKEYVGLNVIAHSSIYCGVITLFIIPFSFIGRKKEVFFFTFMALITLFIILGDRGYVFKILYQYVPGFALFRSPVHYRFAFVFFIALLVGIGLDNLINKNFPDKFKWIIYMLLILMCITGIIIFTIFSPIKYKIPHYLWIDIVFLACIFVCFTILSIYWKKQQISLLILQAAFLLFSFTDFYLHGANSICTGQEMKHEELDRETITMMKVKNKSEWFIDEKIKTPFLPFSENKKNFFRVHVNDGYYDHTGLLPYSPYDSIKLSNIGTNRAIFDKIFMVDGYNPMMLKRYVLFNSTLRDLNYEKFLMLSNVKYIIEPDGTINILPNEKTLSRAFIVTKIENIENSFDILNKMSEPSFNPKEKAFVENAKSLIINSSCQNKPHAKVLRYLPNKIIVQTDSECNGFLVLNETYYPGWKARIDSGKKKDVLKVNYCFMGTAIPGGNHIIDFIFEPKSLKTGFYISFATFLFGVVIFIIALIKKNFKLCIISSVKIV